MTNASFCAPLSLDRRVDLIAADDGKDSAGSVAQAPPPEGALQGL